MTFLKGKKTFLLALLAVIYAVTAYFTHHIDSQTLLQELWAAATAAGLRAGMAGV